MRWLAGLMGLAGLSFFISAGIRRFCGNVRPWCLTIRMADQAPALTAEQVRQVSASVRDLAGCESADLSRDGLLDVLDAAAELHRVSGALMARLAGEVSRKSGPDVVGGGLARKEGHGDAGKMMQRITGDSAPGARRQIEAGDAFTPTPVAEPEGSLPVAGREPVVRPKYPAVAAASVAGKISVDAAALIVAGLNTVRDKTASAVLDEVEARLVDRAQGRTAAEVRRMVAAALARLDKAGVEERQRRQRGERYLSWKQDHNGMVTLHGVLDAVSAAPLLTVIEQMVTKGYRSRRDQDPADPDRRTVGQMRADALFELARHSLGCEGTERSGVRTSLVVRMDVADYMRGEGLGRIDGVDQLIAVSELRRLAGDAEIIPEVLGGDGEVLDLGRAVRFFTRAQRIALLERDGGCAKCHAPPEHCEAHHIRWWEHGGRSDLSNGVMLCTRCHHDVHRQAWEIDIDGNGVHFTPPSSIDPERQPQPGGLAAIDIGDIAIPSAYPDDWEITDELEAAVRQWQSEVPAEQIYEQAGEHDEWWLAPIGWRA